MNICTCLDKRESLRMSRQRWHMVEPLIELIKVSASYEEKLPIGDGTSPVLFPKIKLTNLPTFTALCSAGIISRAGFLLMVFFIILSCRNFIKMSFPNKLLHICHGPGQAKLVLENYSQPSDVNVLPCGRTFGEKFGLREKSLNIACVCCSVGEDQQRRLVRLQH